MIIKLYWKYSDLRCFIKHILNKVHFKLIKEAFISYPFSYEYLYKLEKAKLEEMLKYFYNTNLISSEDSKEICSKINLAVKLLDIIIEDNIQPDVYVNLRNAKRYKPEFIDFMSMLEKYSGTLRVKKALYLYHKLMYRYSNTWWD